MGWRYWQLPGWLPGQEVTRTSCSFWPTHLWPRSHTSRSNFLVARCCLMPWGVATVAKSWRKRTTTRSTSWVTPVSFWYVSQWNLDNKIVKAQHIQTDPKTELDISAVGFVHLKIKSGQTKIEFQTSDPTCRMLWSPPRHTANQKWLISFTVVRFRNERERGRKKANSASSRPYSPIRWIAMLSSW